MLPFDCACPSVRKDEGISRPEKESCKGSCVANRISFVTAGITAERLWIPCYRLEDSRRGRHRSVLRRLHQRSGTPKGIGTSISAKLLEPPIRLGEEPGHAGLKPRSSILVPQQCFSCSYKPHGHVMSRAMI